MFIWVHLDLPNPLFVVGYAHKTQSRMGLTINVP